MTNLEKAYWNGFVKAAGSASDYMNQLEPGLAHQVEAQQQMLSSFPPEIAPYLAKGMGVNEAFQAGGPAMRARLDKEVAPTAAKLQNIQGTPEAGWIGEELNRHPADLAGQQESNKYIQALLEKTDQRMSQFKGVKPQLPPELAGSTGPLSQEAVNNMPTTPVGNTPPPPHQAAPTPPPPALQGPAHTPVTPVSPNTQTPESHGFNWKPWAVGAAIPAAGLGAYYLSKHMGEGQEQPGPQPIEPPKKRRPMRPVGQQRIV